MIRLLLKRMRTDAVLKKTGFQTLWIISLFIFFPVSALAIQLTDNFRLDGFVTQGYLLTSRNNYLGADSSGTFNFNAFNILMKADVNDRFRVWSKISTSSTLQDVLSLEWAFGEYTVSDKFRFKIGKIMLPLGIYNEIRDVYPILPTSILPGIYLDPSKFSPADFRGFSVNGRLSMKKITVLYDIYGGRTGGNLDGQSLQLDNTVGGRFWFQSQSENFRLGFSYFRGLETTSVNRFSEAQYLSSFEYRSPENLNLRGEWGVHQEDNGNTKLGYYLEASYVIKEKWFPVIRYDEYYPVRGRDSNIVDFQKDVTVGLDYRFTDYLTWKAEEHFIHGVALLDPALNPAPEGNWNLFATTVSFLF